MLTILNCIFEAKHKTKTMKKIMRLIAAIVVGVAAIGTGGCTHNGPADAPEIGCDSVTIRVCTIDKETRKAILHPRFSVEYIDSEGNSRRYDLASSIAINDERSRYWIYEDETGEYGEWKIGLPKNGDYDLYVYVGCASIYTDKFGHLIDVPNYRWKSNWTKRVNTRDLRGKKEYTFPDVVLEPASKEELEELSGVVEYIREQLNRLEGG